MKNVLVLLLLALPTLLLSQKREVQHEDFDTWKRIIGQKISRDGNNVLYHLSPGKGDKTLVVSSTNGSQVMSIPRAENGAFTWDNQYAVFTIKPALDSVNQLRRIKTKKELMPKDSLGIVNLSSGAIQKIHGIRKFTVPEKWAGYVFYLLDTPLPEEKKDEADSVEAKKPKPKKMSKENGYHLIAYNTKTQASDTIKYVTDYSVAEKAAAFIYHTTGMDSTIHAGVYHVNLQSGENTPLTRDKKGKFEGLSINSTGEYATFLTDLDTTKALVRNYELRLWKAGQDSARVIVAGGSSQLPQNWLVSKNGRLVFSDDNQKLFFGTTPTPLVQDTTLLEEEIIQVEVWNYSNGRLHTQQNAELEDDKKKSYLAVLDLGSGTISQLESTEIEEVRFDAKYTNNNALGIDYTPYNKFISWEGFPRRQDIYMVDAATGTSTEILKDLRGHAHVSPGGNYIFWFDSNDTTWYVHNNGTKAITKIEISESFADERNDQPNFPGDYGFAGWTKNDAELLLYDRFDIWKYNPESGKTDKITEGRESTTRYRYIDLDPENEEIDPAFMLLSTFNETSKDGGYAQMKKLKGIKQLISGPYSYSRPLKALESDNLIFSKQSQAVFPDLIASDLTFKNELRLSSANPELANYSWGTVEMYKWTSLDGIELEGLLYKPENFDPTQKYPMITYFYERNSDNLHRHWGVVPIRSIVNPAFYSSRGYIVFIPDIVYKTGYPGQSCYNAVMPGVESLVEKGFVDAENLGVQGHSWGGYQVAYLVTQTDKFKAAEAGAVVSNMTSAYGGIRWWTGLSRMFQYEHTQSRIGGTLWQYPELYIENSPIFMTDKIETPLLLMHNDADGHVPWYQGIEFFVALRRLNKPAWMLNYNGEPHWPTKYENIRDFNIRMQQFFDHYLKGAPMPRWMSTDGVPAIEKGITNGLELMSEE